jgi:hypothetical protein
MSRNLLSENSQRYETPRLWAIYKTLEDNTVWIEINFLASVDVYEIL